MSNDMPERLGNFSQLAAAVTTATATDSTEAITSSERQTDQRKLEAQLAAAETLLEECGYERQPDGSYSHSFEAMKSAWELDSYQFRDAVRAEEKSALERLHDEVEFALIDLGDRFGIEGADFALLAQSEELPVTEILNRCIREEADTDAELKKEAELEEIAELLDDVQTRANEIAFKTCQLRAALFESDGEESTGGEQ